MSRSRSSLPRQRLEQFAELNHQFLAEIWITGDGVFGSMSQVPIFKPRERDQCFGVLDCPERH